MPDPINLRLARKRKTRLEKEKLANANRNKHGISSKLKQTAKLENAANLQRLDAHLRVVYDDKTKN